MIETLFSLAERAGVLNPRGTIEARDSMDPSQSAGASLENPRNSWDRVFDVEPTYTGKPVTEVTALRLTAVWRCVSLIAGAVARTSFLPFTRVEDVGKVKATTHYLWRLFTYEANSQLNLTAYRFRRMMQTWVLLWGNAYAEIEIDGRGRVVGLWPMRPDRMQFDLIGGLPYYTYTKDSGERVSLPKDKVLHIRGLELDGWKGKSPIAAARQSIGLGLAAEEYGARYFGNSGKPGGWIEHPGKLNDTSRKNLRESIEDIHRGLRGAHRIGIFEEGMKYHDVGLPPEDMQFLQTRQFQGIDVARLYGVPPHKIAELSRATFSNIEEQGIDFVNDCLSDWFVNWEQECTCSLLSAREADTTLLMFMRSELMRGDSLKRAQAHSLYRNMGAESANDIRDDLDKNRIPADDGGDLYLLAMNMAPLGTAIDDDPTNEDDPGAGPDGDDDQTEDDSEQTPAPAAAKKKKAKASRRWARMKSLVNGAPPVPIERTNDGTRN